MTTEIRIIRQKDVTDYTIIRVGNIKSDICNIKSRHFQAKTVKFIKDTEIHYKSYKGDQRICMSYVNTIDKFTVK